METDEFPLTPNPNLASPWLGSHNAWGAARGSASGHKIKPRVFIIVMFKLEAEHYLSPDSALQFPRKITIPGLTRGYEEIHMTADNSVCLLVVGQALINAALSVSALTNSPLFSLAKTYFVLQGIAGVNPKHGTIGSVAFAKFAIQTDLQYEFDAREIPEVWEGGYVPLGAETAGGSPGWLNGSEVYELNEDLRAILLGVSKGVKLEDDQKAKQHRREYAGAINDVYAIAAQGPSVLEGDVASSNVFWHGHMLCEGMERLFETYTGGKAEYVMTAQEDTAILTTMLRATLQGHADFTRIILMRSGSNFDRPPRRDSKHEIPFVLDRGGLSIAVRNLYLCGVEVVQSILLGWESMFERGVEAENYVGDIFGSLGGAPDFGPHSKST